MLRAAFHEALENADREVVTLAALLVDALRVSLRALDRGDPTAAARVIAGADAHADAAKRIESQCLEMIWRQQPVAGELRQIAAMLEIAIDLQRINVFTADVAKYVVRLLDGGEQPARAQVEAFAQFVAETFDAAAQAYRERNRDAAIKVSREDGTADDLYEKAIAALQDEMTHHPENIGSASTMLLAISALQRTYEHAVDFGWQTLTLTPV